MGTIIVVAILAVVVVVALVQSRKHLKGEGGCCGGGSEPVSGPAEEKTLEGPEIGRKLLRIEGMHCVNCQRSVERQLNRLDGVAASVDWKAGTALVRYDREVSEQLLRLTVERLDYKVTAIESLEKET